jgi:RimJ/RimL family protein N-acetyltransferase
MSVLLQPAGPDDYPAIAALRVGEAPETALSAAELRDYDAATRNAGKRARRWLVYRDGQPAAEVSLRELQHFGAPGRRLAWITVARAHRRQGLGRDVYRALCAEARAEGADELMAAVFGAGGGVPFATAMGLGRIAAEISLELDLATIDVDALQTLAERPAALGVRVQPLADLKAEVPDWMERLWQLHNDVYARVPSPIAFVPPSLASFREMDVENPYALHAGLFVARHGDQWVGFSELRRRDEPTQGLSQYLTGVDAQWVGRGLAGGLKAIATLWARAGGYPKVITGVADDNPAMCAVNRRIGFKEVGRWVTVSGAP